MIRLLKIELRKLVSYKAFWVMLIIYTAILAIMIFGIPGLIDWVAEKSGEATKLRIFKSIAFVFPDVWQNITFVASLQYFIKIILGLIIIIIMTSEYTFLTIRSNIISGLSKKDFLFGKIELIILLGVFSTLVVFLSGLYLGFLHTPSPSLGNVFGKMLFLLAYFIEIISFLFFCLMFGIIFKKTGLTFIALVVYLIVEPILGFKLNDKIAEYLPLEVINNIIQSPNTSLMKVKRSDFPFEFQEAIHFTDLLFCLIYASAFILISYLILKKRDL
jgi:ABC-type transport system involved in multi-copper enzyme maturation permease subunit